MTRAKRYLLALAGLAVLAGAPLYVARSAPHIPPYDANLVRLAESELEGYCAGETFWGSQAQGNADMARDCRSRLAGQKAEAPNLPAVVPAFCAAIIDSGWEGYQWQCEEIMASNNDVHDHPCAFNDWCCAERGRGGVHARSCAARHRLVWCGRCARAAGLQADLRGADLTDANFQKGIR